MAFFIRRAKYKDDGLMVAALMQGDDAAVRYVFFEHYDALLRYNARKACKDVCPFDDLRQELYLYLSADGWNRLHGYDPQLPFENWLSVVSYRFFKDQARLHLAEPIERNTHIDELASLGGNKDEFSTIAGIDLASALSSIELPRDHAILQALLIDGEEPDAVAARMGMTVANLYNLKRRALARVIKQSLSVYQEGR